MSPVAAAPMTPPFVVIAYALPFARPLVTARGSTRIRRGYLLGLADEAGRVGWGEAAPLPGHGGETLAEAGRALEAMAAALHADLAAGRLEIAVDAARHGERMALLTREWPAAPCALAAVDSALADLAAQRAGLPLARWLAADARPAVWVNAVIGAVSPRRAARLAAAASADGYRAVKVKLGGDDIADLQRVAAVRAALRHETELRADANGAWDPLRAEVMLDALAAHRVAYVEQPVPAGDVAALARLRREAGTPVAADEALLVPGGAARVLESEAADVLVLKPSLLGGLCAARRLAEQALARGMGVVVSSSLETAVGRTAALHLAAALAGPERPSGLATGHLFARDVAVAAAPDRGRMRLPSGAGLGVRVTADGIANAGAGFDARASTQDQDTPGATGHDASNPVWTN